MKYSSNSNVIYSSLLRFRTYNHKHMLRYTNRMRTCLYDECFDTRSEYSELWVRIKYFNKRLSKARSARLKTLRSVSENQRGKQNDSKNIKRSL